MPLAAEWPDWSGGTVVIVATGPSAQLVPLSQVKGRARVIAIKTSWHLAPWADALYGCDYTWWVEARGVPKFRQLKFCPSPRVCKVYSDIRLIRLKSVERIVVGETGLVGCGHRSGGGHSGFHAINLAVQFGARRIVLAGFDMTLRGGQHWHPHQPGTQARKDPKIVEECRVALDACAPQFAELGVEVINASAGSALRNYRKMSLVEAVA